MAKERILRGNQHYSAGKLGARTCITTGHLESSEAQIIDIRGRHYTTVVIEKTVERNATLELLSQQIDDKKCVRAQLTLRSDQLRTTRTEHTVELYARAAFGNVIQKPKNAIQKQTGFDITNRMRGEVPYSSLRIVYIGFICERWELYPSMII